MKPRLEPSLQPLQRSPRRRALEDRGTGRAVRPSRSLAYIERLQYPAAQANGRRKNDPSPRVDFFPNEAEKLLKIKENARKNEAKRG